jgi:hypothetical protein
MFAKTLQAMVELQAICVNDARTTRPDGRDCRLKTRGIAPDFSNMGQLPHDSSCQLTTFLSIAAN